MEKGTFQSPFTSLFPDSVRRLPEFTSERIVGTGEYTSSEPGHYQYSHEHREYIGLRAYPVTTG
jgi:hypothetical protein